MRKRFVAFVTAVSLVGAGVVLGTQPNVLMAEETEQASTEEVTGVGSVLAGYRSAQAMEVNDEVIVSYTIPEWYDAIGEMAFAGNCGLDELYMTANTIVSIGANAFASCTSLAKVELSNKLKTIGVYAFNECVNLKEIYIPQSVEQIGECAFPVGCTLIVEPGSYGEDYAKNVGYSYIDVSTGMLHEGNGTAGQHENTLDPVETLKPEVTQAPEVTTMPEPTSTAKPVTVGTVKIKSVKKASKTSMKVVLKKVTGAKGYQIYYSTDKKIKKFKKLTISKTSTVINKLKKGKTYYVKARAYKLSNGKKVYGKFSGIKKVSLK